MKRQAQYLQQSCVDSVMVNVKQIGMFACLTGFNCKYPVVPGINMGQGHCFLTWTREET